MINIMSEEYYKKAKQNRERVAREQDTKAYYWWQMDDPFGIEAATSNPNGLARTRKELRNRQRRLIA